MASAPIDLSVVVPVRDEAPSIDALCRAILAVFDRIGKSGELVVVDDGSTDQSARIVERLAAADARVRLIELRRNFGQTAALMAGFDHARGAIIVPMDGDGQNDPEDIPLLLAKIEEGFDVVSGWRQNRQDHENFRHFPSRLANRLISVATGVALNDYGCTLKAYRRDILDGVRLYGEMHRFIPVYASWEGARIAEIPVRHHARRHGRSNYGLERTMKVLLDLMVVMFLGRYAVKPIYVFGLFGLGSLAISFLSGVYAVYLKWVHDFSFVQTPLPLLSILMLAIGLTFLLSGLLAEMIVRTYHESQDKRSYTVRRKVNFDPP